MTNKEHHFGNNTNNRNTKEALISFGKFLNHYKSSRTMSDYWVMNEDTTDIFSTENMFEIWLNLEHDK